MALPKFEEQFNLPANPDQEDGFPQAERRRSATS
jgi:hypothetical protein